MDEKNALIQKVNWFMVDIIGPAQPYLERKCILQEIHSSFSPIVITITSSLSQKTENTKSHMQVSFLCFHPKTGGRRIVSLDGMFGLKRWKKSGESYSPPRYNETFFINQSEVDTFLKGYKQAKNTEQVSQFTITVFHHEQ